MRLRSNRCGAPGPSASTLSKTGLVSAISQGLRGEPCCAVLADQRDRFIDRVYAMRDGEIDLAGEFNAFAEHRAATPIEEFGGRIFVTETNDVGLSEG